MFNAPVSDTEDCVLEATGASVQITNDKELFHEKIQRQIAKT